MTTTSEVLRKLIVESATKPHVDDTRLKNLAESALIVAADSVEENKEEASGLEAIALLQDLTGTGPARNVRYSRPMFRVLHDAIVAGFVKTENPVFADTLRLWPPTQDNQYETALREGLNRCFDLDKLSGFVAGSSANTINRSGLVKVSQRRAAVAGIGSNYVDKIIFEAKCGKAVEHYLSLVGNACIEAVEQAACVAKSVQEIRLPFGVPSKWETQMPNIDFVRIMWWTAPREDLGAAIENGTSSMDKWAEEIRQQVGPRPSRIYNLDIALRILPYSFGWEHTVDKTEPLHTIVRSI